MTDEEFEIFLQTSLDELWEKQDRLENEHGFSSFSRWFFDQETGLLELFDAKEKKVLEAAVIGIGSYARNSNTWKWAWSNESIVPSLRLKAEALKELEKITGIELFTDASAFEIENEAMAWELAAISVKHLNALGVYKAPSSARPLETFLAITKIQPERA